MGRLTFAVVLLASAACGLELVGEEKEKGAAPGIPSVPTPTADGATPVVPASDGGVRANDAAYPDADADADAEPPTPPASSLKLTRGTLPTTATIDLTAAGTIDWVNWGQPKTRKAVSAPAIGSFTTQGSGDCTSYDFPCSLQWSDGLSPAAFSGHAGRCIFAVNSFYAFDVLATTKLRTLTLLLGAYYARGKITVTLSDGTPPQTDASLDNPTESMATIAYTVTFSAAVGAGTSLHVDWRDDSQRTGGSVYLGTAAVRE